MVLKRDFLEEAAAMAKIAPNSGGYNHSYRVLPILRR